MATAEGSGRDKPRVISGVARPYVLLMRHKFMRARERRATARRFVPEIDGMHLGVA